MSTVGGNLFYVVFVVEKNEKNLADANRAGAAAAGFIFPLMFAAKEGSLEKQLLIMISPFTFLDRQVVTSEFLFLGEKNCVPLAARNKSEIPFIYNIINAAAMNKGQSHSKVYYWVQLHSFIHRLLSAPFLEEKPVLRYQSGVDKCSPSSIIL